MRILFKYSHFFGDAILILLLILDKKTTKYLIYFIFYDIISIMKTK